MRASPGHRFFISHSTLAGVGVITLLMLLVALMFFRQGQSVSHAKGMVLHTYEVTGHIQTLMNRLKDAEIGQRGYLLTGEEAYLAAYRQAVGGEGDSITTELAALKALTADNPLQQRELTNLETLIHQRTERLAMVIALRKNEGLEAAVHETQRLRGKAMMDRIAQVIDAMVSEENRLLAIRTRTDEASMHRTVQLMVGGLALFYAGMLLAPWLVTRHSRMARMMEAEVYLRAQEVVDTNQQLDASRAFLKNIIDSIPDPIFVKDMQHRLIDGNEAMWALFGRKEEEVIGKSDYDFFPKEEADVFWKKDQEVFSSGKANINIENFTDAAGVTHVISTKKACFVGPRGEPILVGVIRDITELRKMEDKLRDSDEQRLKSIMDHSGRPVYIKDLEGRFLQVNKELLQRLELKEEDVLGKSCHELFPKDAADEYRAHDKAVIAAGAAMEFEEIAMHPSGRHVYSSVKFPLYDANGHIYAICGISTDITGRKQEELAKSWLAAIVQSSDDVIISKSVDDIITSWNKAAARLFGYSAQEAVGQPITLIIPPERRGEEEEMWLRLRAGHSIEHFETVRIARDGKQIAVSLTVSPVYDAAGVMVGASKILRDITQRKEVEERLARYMHALERSNQELDDFAYIASHDLKEPLRGLYNHAAFLIEDYQDKLGADGVHRLTRLSELSQRMERLVNDLLYFSRLGRTELAIQESDPNQMVVDIQQMLEPFLKERNAHITVPKPMPRVVCDMPRITEVFRNLITNAVKYNDKPERLIEVGFLTEVGSERDVFYVKDNGIGIDKEFYEAIFRIFKRLQPRGKEGEPGTGAGLTFVKKIIERHNGRIWLDSTPGTGSIFYFTIGTITSLDRRAA